MLNQEEQTAAAAAAAAAAATAAEITTRRRELKKYSLRYFQLKMKGTLQRRRNFRERKQPARIHNLHLPSVSLPKQQFNISLFFYPKNVGFYQAEVHSSRRLLKLTLCQI